MSTRTINVDYLARVEGEGGMTVRIRNGAVDEVQLRIYEPPRFFEAFMRGRHHSEAPDITSRICGICPVAYQMSAVHAMEDVAGVKVGGALRDLRRLLYCGEWIESHLLHMWLLHAPDFLGYPSVVEMAADHHEMVQRVLRLKKAGNDIVTTLAGREIHPINARVGGWYKLPKRRDFAALREELAWGYDASIEALRFAATLPMPEFEKDYEFVSLRHPGEYPMCEGRLVSNRGLDIDISEYNEHFEEMHVPHSNALHAVLRQRDAYFVGPLARYNLNFDLLPAEIQALALDIGLQRECRNPFQSLLVRGVETSYAFGEALRILDQYEPPESPCLNVAPASGVGHGCTEAPRGILYHRYELDSEGLIRSAQIVPPTSQNQKTIEDDLYHFVTQHMDLSDDDLQWQCEQAIRNYDPCISCATHFLSLEVDRD